MLNTICTTSIWIKYDINNTTNNFDDMEELKKKSSDWRELVDKSV